jgi:hypothetical protein
MNTIKLLILDLCETFKSLFTPLPIVGNPVDPIQLVTVDEEIPETVAVKKENFATIPVIEKPTETKCKSNCGCTHNHLSGTRLKPKSKKKITKKKLLKG